jgi:hypothetical protein
MLKIKLIASKGIIYQETVRVTNRYQADIDKAIYVATASRFRLPFWDIVMPRNKPGHGKDADAIWGTP